MLKMAKTLTVKVLANPEALANACRTQSRRTATYHACCPFPATDCPIRMAEACYLVEPKHWEEELEKENEDGKKED